MRTRQALGVDRGRLLLQVDGDSVHLRLQQAGEVRDLAVLPSLADLTAAAASDPLEPLLPPRVAELPRWLLLPPASSLRRRLNLPAAAAERLRDVVGFEIDRQTPFTADAVAYDARVLARRDADGQLDAELVAVPRQVLDPQLAAIGPLASTLSGIEVAGADGAPLGVNLLPPAQRSTRSDPFRYWNLALAAVAVLALAAALWQVLENRREAIADLKQTISRNAAGARQAAIQRQELVDLIQGQAFLDRTRKARPSTVEVIDELSRRLPDGTYLEKLAIEDESLLMIGLSGEASALIGKLQGTPLWRSPALTGAVQPDPATNRDRFTLTAEIGPPKPQNPEAARGP
nr:PilN domain-containing protein [Lysobacter antibioticus]